MTLMMLIFFQYTQYQ